MKIKVILVLMIGFTLSVTAQDSTAWDLSRCVKHAHANNLTVKRQQLNVQYNAVQLEQKRYSMLPNLNVNSNYRIGFGRTLDQSDYTYHNATTQSVDAGINSSVSLFEGFSKQNDIKKSKTDLAAAQVDVDKTKNDIGLQLANQYLLILYSQEILAVAKEQLSQSEQMVIQTEKQVKAGSKAPGALLDMKSQMAKESVAVIQAENNLNLATLNLVQMLDLDSVKGFSIVVPVLPEVLPGLLSPPDEVYNSAVQNMPEIKGSQLRVESKNYQLASAKGGIYPSLTLNGGFGSQLAYYEGKQSISFMDEYNNNRNSYLGLSLNIPIFNGHRTTTSIKSAKFDIEDAQYALAQQKLTLRKEIQQASNEALGAYKKYLASQDALEAYKENFKYTQKRFDVEMVNAVDYNLAKTNLLKAESDLLQSKYEYIFKTKILDFYKGIEITL